MDYLDAFLVLIMRCLLGQAAAGQRRTVGRLSARLDMLPMLAPALAVIPPGGGYADWDRGAPPFRWRLRPAATCAGDCWPPPQRLSRII